ncbi:MAG: tRNA (N6-threonylcarbamoyladenosine(37)-N6)-methyltransferase TrmO [Dehalococcoidia bacterium]
MTFKIEPIGFVKSGIKNRRKVVNSRSKAQIVVEPSYEKALDGIDSFSHVIIVFWLHKIKKNERSIMQVHPYRNPSLPLKGVFATRSPVRPNPIGLTVVKLIKRKGNVLTVMGLDAIDGTPVLDIKPYVPEPFLKAEISLPGWIKKNKRKAT